MKLVRPFLFVKCEKNSSVAELDLSKPKKEEEEKGNIKCKFKKTKLVSSLSKMYSLQLNENNWSAIKAGIYR